MVVAVQRSDSIQILNEAKTHSEKEIYCSQLKKFMFCFPSKTRLFDIYKFRLFDLF